MSTYITREGPMATVNVWTQLTTCGSLGTVGPVIVPGNKHSIKEIWLSFCEGGPADTSGGLHCLKLTGPGMKYGDQFFIAGGIGREETGNSSYSDAMTPVKLKVDLAVNPNGEIYVFGGQYGTDQGTPELEVTLVFSSDSAPERYYVLRQLACGTLDTDTLLTATMSETTNQFQPPAHCKHMYSVITAVAGITLATATGGTAYVRLRGGIADGEQVICAGGLGNLSTTTGVSGGYSFAVQTPCNLSLTGAPIAAYGCQSGVDWGTPYIGVVMEVGP